MKALLWIGSIIVALAVGSMLRPTPAAEAPRSIHTREVVSVASPVPTDAIRAAVRAELANLHEPVAAREQRVEAPEPPAGDPAAVEQVLDAIRDRSADGVWSDDDRTALLPLLASLTGPQRTQVMDALFPLINSDRLRVTTHGPPI